MKKDEFEVRFKVLQVLSSIDMRKEFFRKEFFDFYSAVLSNQQKKNMKKHFIQSIKLFQQYDLIENNYKIISNGFFLDTDV